MPGINTGEHKQDSTKNHQHHFVTSIGTLRVQTQLINASSPLCNAYYPHKPIITPAVAPMAAPAATPHGPPRAPSSTPAIASLPTKVPQPTPPEIAPAVPNPTAWAQFPPFISSSTGDSFCNIIFTSLTVLSYFCNYHSSAPATYG